MDGTAIPGPRAPQRCDVAVIGSGLGGLSCAVHLARAGLTVHVFEQGSSAGGFATSFSRSGYRFDASLQSMDAVGPGEPYHELLEDLGVVRRLHLARDRWSHREKTGGIDLWIPRGADAWVELLAKRFPGERRGLRELISRARHVHSESFDFLQGWWSGRPSSAPPGDIRPLLHQTAAQIIERHIEDPTARELVGIRTGYLGLLPDRMSAFTWLLILAGYQIWGGWTVLGGGAALTGALAAELAHHGGTLWTDQPVEGLLLDGRQATGVRLKEGCQVAAAAVVCNASPATALRLLPRAGGALSRWRAQLSSLEPSVSAVKLWLGLDVAPQSLAEVAYETVLRQPDLPSWALGRTIHVAAPSLLDPGCCPPGRGVLSATAVVPATAGERRARGHRGTATELAHAVERHLIPGLSESIHVMETATPQTFHEYTGSPGGAIFGYAHTPSQAGPRRPAATTPVDGLYLASGWANPGAGYTSCLIAGRNAARWVLEGLLQRDLSSPTLGF